LTLAASLALLSMSRSGTLSVGADSTIAPLIGAALALAAAVKGDHAQLSAMVGVLVFKIYAARLE
jgi:hypothetical protein